MRVTRFGKKKRGISTFIATLLLIVLAVAAGVVIYAYVMGYLGTMSVTTPIGGTIQFQSVVQNPQNPNELWMYLKNIGKGTVSVSPADPNNSIYIDGVKLTGGTSDSPTLTEGQTTRVVIPIPSTVTPGNTITIKLVTADGTFAQAEYTVTSSTVVAGPASKIVYTVGAGQTLAANTVSAPIAVQRQDISGNPTTNGTITMNLGSSSTTGTFYSDAGGTTAITQVTIAAGSSATSFYYEDTATGTPTLTVSYSGLTSATSQFTITAAAGPVSKLVYTVGAGQTVNAGSVSSVVTVQRQDANGVPVTSGSLVVNLGTNSTGAFYSDAGGTTVITTATITTGSTASFYYKDTVVGKPILTASSGSLTSATTQFTIALVTGPATKLAYTAGTTQTLAAGSVSAIVTVQRQDASGNPTTTGAITVSLATSTSSTGKFYSDAGGTTQITTVAIAAGSSSASFYYKDTAAGSPILTSSSGSLTSATTTFTISTAPPVFDHFGLTGYPTSIVSGVSFGNVMVTAYDQYNNIYTAYTGSIWFTTSDGSGVLPTNANQGQHFVFTSSDSGTYNFTGFKLLTQPSQTITVTDGAKSATSNAITVTPPASKLVILSGGSQTLAIDSLSGEVVVQRQDSIGSPVNADALVVGLYSTSSGATFYSDAGVTPTTSVTIPAGANSTSFWYKDSVAGTPTLTASAGTLTSATTTFTISAGAATTLVYTTSTQTLPAGSVSGVITVQRQDLHGNPVTSGTIDLDLTTTSTTGKFYSDASGTTQITTVSIADTSSVASFYYMDTNAGTPTLTAASAGLTSATAVFTINSASASMLSFYVGAGQTVAANTPSTGIIVQFQTPTETLYNALVYPSTFPAT